MSRKSSLTEWLEQTKKISKSVDYICMDAIDSIIRIVYLVEKKSLRRHKNFFDHFCIKYHKPNPLDIMNDREVAFDLFSQHHGIKKIDKCKKYQKVLTSYVDSTVHRCNQAMQDILWQWFEVIDFMYERPELVNPNAVDDYVEKKIYEVCSTHQKNNPLEDGMRERFGKSWKDNAGNWREERRSSF